MSTPLAASALDQLFGNARSFSGFLPTPVTETTIHQLYDLLKWGPTAFNTQPARYVFVQSAEAKAKLAPALSSGNREKTVAAPVTVIIAHDTRFFEHLPEQFPAYDAKPMFVANPGMVEPTAMRNGSLQGGYLIMAARALGLDVGPMSGFDAAAVNQAFFPDGRYQVNFIANLGYGDSATLFPRSPRLTFEQAVTLA